MAEKDNNLLSEMEPAMRSINSETEFVMFRGEKIDIDLFQFEYNKIIYRLNARKRAAELGNELDKIQKEIEERQERLKELEDEFRAAVIAMSSY